MAFVPLNTTNSNKANFNSVNDAVRDISNRLRPIKTPDKAWREVGATNQPAFQNSWVNYDVNSFYAAAFYKDAFGFVHLRGLVKSGTVGTGSAIYTLPVKYRPLRQIGYAVNAGNAFGNLRIGTDGKVFLETGSNSYVFLDGITFEAEQ